GDASSSGCWGCEIIGGDRDRTRHDPTGLPGRPRRTRTTMSITTPERDLVKTGIKGLDSILFGGIPRGNIILLEGAAGTGKSTLGLEFIYRGITEFGEPGMMILFEVSPDKLVRDAMQFGWDLRAL